MDVHVNGTRLFVDVDGALLVPDDGTLVERPTVVVLHGGPGFDQGYLRPGLAALADDAQVFYVDLRGQGRSEPRPAEECTLEQMADDVAGLCVLLGIDSPVVLGHSAGGFVALHVAIRHPHLARGLVLCSTTATLAPDRQAGPPLAGRGSPDAVRAAGRLFSGDFSPDVLEEFDRLVLPLYAAATHADVPSRLMRLSRMTTDVAAHFFPVLASAYDVRPHLPGLRIPALVVVGSEDWVTPPVAARRLAEGLPDARLVIVPGAGHFPFSEEPELFLEAVRAFLAGL